MRGVNLAQAVAKQRFSTPGMTLLEAIRHCINETEHAYHTLVTLKEKISEGSAVRALERYIVQLDILLVELGLSPASNVYYALDQDGDLSAVAHHTAIVIAKLGKLSQTGGDQDELYEAAEAYRSIVRSNLLPE